MHWRLSLLMFLQYAVPGAVIPFYSVRLHELGFTPWELGAACATSALAALIAPLIAGQIADRWCPVERCVAFCSLLAAGMLGLLAELTEPLPVFAITLAFWLFMTPALTLGTSLCFAHLPSVEKEFGRIRLWGTMGWIAPGWLIGWWLTWPDRGLADAFRLAALLALILAIYSLTLPHTPPQHRGGPWLAPLGALHLLRERAFAIYLLCTLGMCITFPFSSQVTPLLLEYLGVPRPWLGPTLSIAQSIEVLALLWLPHFLIQIGPRTTILVGMVAWVTALGILTLGWPTWFVIASQTLNGICVCFFLIAGQVFVNSRAQGDIRASSQALLTMANGVGLLIGNLFVAWVRHAVNGQFAPTFGVAAALAGLLVAVFWLGFDANPSREP